MKFIIFITMFLTISFLSYGQGCPSIFTTTLPSPDFRQWDLACTFTVLKDDFNDNNLNTAIWGVRTGCVRNTDVEAQHYKNNLSNVIVSNGTLKLTARKETTWDWINPPSGQTGDPTWGTRDYTSGEIYSLSDTFYYGEYTIRCRFPIGSGSWAAFWMFGCVPGQCNEIDFFEQKNRDGQNGHEIDNVFHWYYSGGECGPEYKNWPNDVSNWHVYRCVWTPYEIKFYIDDMNTPAQKWSRYATINLQYVGIQDIMEGVAYTVNANYPIYSGGIIANYALNGSVGIDATMLPQSFEIDYIRVREFFLAPEITCPQIICSTGTASMNVDPAATNISWALTPTNLFSGATTGNGTTANITASSTNHGKGKITYSFNISSDQSIPKETYTAEKEIWINGPDYSEVSFDVYRSDGTHATKVGNTWIMCPNTTYHIYVMNSSPVPLSNYSWTIPSAWTRNYTYQNMISVYTNSSPGGPVSVSATNTASGCNNTIPVITGYMGSSYSCGSYYMTFTPNPATSETTMELSADGEKVLTENTEWEFEVYDQQQGLKEKKTNVKGKQTKINTTGWKDGIYIVRVLVGDELISDKLMVKKQ